MREWDLWIFAEGYISTGGIKTKFIGKGGEELMLKKIMVLCIDFLKEASGEIDFENI